MSEVNQAVEVKQEGEFSLKGKKKTPKKFSDTSNNEPVKVDLTKPEAQGEVIPSMNMNEPEKKSSKGLLSRNDNTSNKSKMNNKNDQNQWSVRSI